MSNRLALAACAAAILAIASQGSQAQEFSQEKDFNIPAQTLSQALVQFSDQSGIQVVTSGADVSKLTTGGVKGHLTIQRALRTLLIGTSLTYQVVGSSTVALVPPLSRADNHSADPRPGPDQAGDHESRVAVDPQQSPSKARSQPAPDDTGHRGLLDEIVVTAEKRVERLQDVPVPVTEISADTLLDSNQSRLQDYYASVPGLSLTASGPGMVQLAIRGVTTGGNTNPTVGVAVDDVPYGSSSALTFAAQNVPSLDPSDLASVEVLRGPQGTLYGASSIGGLIKFVTVDPSTDSFSGRVQSEINSIYNAVDPGYGVRAAVNVPITDTVAVRASGFSRQDPGYIDDPTLHIDGVNKIDAYGGRVSLLWRPSAAFSLKVSTVLQNTTGDGTSDVMVQPGLGDLQQSVLRGTGGYSQRLRLYTANLTADLGGITLTAVSGYQDNKVYQIFDATSYYSGLADQYFGVTGVSGANSLETKKFTQELRLSSSIGTRLDWLLGLFYTHEASPTSEPLLAIDPTTGQIAGLLADFNFPTSFEEYAAFADATLHLTERFDLQLGGRESHNRQIYHETDIGPFNEILFGLPSPLVIPPIHTNDSAFTYLVTPQFKISSDLMVYARLASGYRPGGPNPDATLFKNAGHEGYGADKTTNYEAGFKGDLNDHRLSFDASVYYIEWNDIQLQLTNPVSGFTYFVNGGTAKSQGLELAAQALPLRGLTLAAWVAWNDAELTSNLPPESAIGSAGDRLPYSSRFSGNVSVLEEQAITGTTTAFAGASMSYVGDRYDIFSGTPGQVRGHFPGYTKVDAHAGIRRGSWTVNLFVNNAGDRRGVLATTPVGPTTNAYTFIQPRTVGLSLSLNF